MSLSGVERNSANGLAIRLPAYNGSKSTVCWGNGRFELPRVSGSPPQEISFPAFVATRFKKLVEQNTECTTCPWQQVCQGYFKWPDPVYDCRGIKHLFSIIKTAADEIGQELAYRDQANLEEQHLKFGFEASW